MKFSVPASILVAAASATVGVSTAILYPSANTVWKVYGKHNVTWDIPADVSNPGRVQLRRGTDMIRTIAKNVDLTLGRQAIAVPSDLAAGSDYYIVLKGANDSVTISKGQEFQIYGASGEFWGYPPVTYPRAGTVWKLGSVHNVTWTIDFAPKIIANKGAIFLRKNLVENYRRVSDYDFDLSTGRQEITIPKDITPGKYRLTLEGYVNNYTEEFTISK